MKTIGGNIEITKQSGITSISAIMPTWNKVEDDNTLSINIPLFGLKTIAIDEEDAETAISEAIQCFCIAAEKFGQGVEAELMTLGWECVKTKNKSTLTYSIESKNFVLEQIMQTGEQHAFTNIAIA